MGLRLALLFLSLLLFAVVVPAAAQTAILPVSIDVERVTVQLAPADADAFQRRLNRPPLLDDPPAAGGPSYTVTTAYWNPAIREEEDDPAVEAVAEYFPAGGFVRARQDGEDVWIVLDLRQRAILDRYIALYREQPQPELDLRPGALWMAVAMTPREQISIEAGDRRLTPEEASLFWEALNGRLDAEFIDPPRPPAADSSTGYWITFTLPEGRAMPYFHDTAAGSLTDALGTETYDISNAGSHRIPAAAEVRLIQQDGPAGSTVWWPVALGGGTALLALALWLRRRAPSSS